MNNSADLIASLLKTSKGLSLLSVGSSPVDCAAWMKHTSRMAMVGSHRPLTIDVDDFTFLHGIDRSSVCRNLKELARRGQHYDVILIDHDHRLLALHEQIELCLELSYPETMFLFDDAVPPSFEMATAEPKMGWWAGQVCYLRQLLRKRSTEAILECIKIPPTGLMLAQNFFLPSKADFVAVSASAPTSDAQLEEISEPAVWGDIEKSMLSGMERLANRRLIPIKLADDSLCSAMRVLDPADYIDRRSPAFVCLARSDESLVGVDKLHVSRRKRHEKRLYTYDRALLVGQDYILKSDQVAPRYFGIGASQLERVGKEYGSVGNDHTGLMLHNGKLKIDASYLDEPECLTGHVLLATPDEPMNYGMWLLLTLLTVSEFLRNRESYDKLLCYCPKQWQKSMLGSGLIDHIQKITMAAMAIADMKV
jgi:hypothetical protein